MKKLLALLLAGSIATGAQAAEWQTGSWTPVEGAAGTCHWDGEGTTRIEVREVACRAPEGTVLRDVDCEDQVRPENMNAAACTMAWTCERALEGVYVDGEKIALAPVAATGEEGLTPAQACANAKQADPAAVHSCRASHAEEAVEVLSSASGSGPSNMSYDWITCQASAG